MLLVVGVVVMMLVMLVLIGLSFYEVCECNIVIVIWGVVVIVGVVFGLIIGGWLL